MSYSGISHIALPASQANGAGHKRAGTAETTGTQQWKRKRVKTCASTIPKIMHTIWLNEQCSGTIPQDRFVNILSLAKQFRSEGWHVKIWTNNPSILHRAATSACTSTGVALEVHFNQELNSAFSNKGSIEICSDKELFPIMEEVNAELYNKHNEAYHLPDLWSPHNKH